MRPKKPKATTPPRRRALQRRVPSQERSRATIDVILDATAQILEGEGPGALNTNAIAARAGVSIGTVYEYFPDKESILVAVARHQLARDQERMLAALVPRDDESPRAWIARVVQALVDVHAADERVRRVSMRTHTSVGLGDEQDEPVRVAEATLRQLDSLRLPAGSARSKLTLFVVTRAVLGVVRSAVRENPELLRDPALARELVRLACAMLGVPDEG